jgi:putative ATP-binding cassette transporter
VKSIYFFLRYSRRYVLLAVLTGVISGISSTGLLALISVALKGKSLSASALMLAFVGLCIVVALSRIASELLLSRIGQRAMFELRLSLCQQVLSVPLRRLEEIGMHRVLTALSDDVPAITNAVATIPVLCINTAIVVGCLIYLGFLSWIALPAMMIFLMMGIATYQLAVIRGMRYFKSARTDGDSLFRHFQSLTGGIKELKLNRRRREAFTADVLKPTASSFQRHNILGQAIYTVAASWGPSLRHCWPRCSLCRWPDAAACPAPRAPPTGRPSCRPPKGRAG